MAKVMDDVMSGLRVPSALTLDVRRVVVTVRLTVGLAALLSLACSCPSVSTTNCPPPTLTTLSPIMVALGSAVELVLELLELGRR